MHCPFCVAQDTKVIDSRWAGEGHQVRRRRECLECSARFTTYEVVEFHWPRILKRDGRIENFNPDKLRRSLLVALEKRPIAASAIDASIKQLLQRLQGSGERELSAMELGEWAMAALKELDHVAYVRFASVYRQFQDLEAFRTEIEALVNGEKGDKG